MVESARNSDDTAGITKSLVVFDVVGKPEPQGSKRAFVRGGRAMIVESARNVGSWRRLVADKAADVAPQTPMQLAVKVEIHFRLPVPKSAPKRRRLYAVKKPDVDKLARACLDAMTKVVYRDDSQIVDLHVTKQLAYDMPIGCAVIVQEIEPSQSTKGGQ